MNIRGIDLYVTDKGAGLPILWCHGLTGSIAGDDEGGILDWQRVAAAHRVIRWDALGHGESGFTANPQDYAWSNLALDALAIADALGIPQFFLGGGSMGCGMSIHAARLAPERIRGLLLGTPSTAWETRTASRANFETMARQVEEQGISALTASWGAPTTFWGRYTYREDAGYLDQADPTRLPTLFRGAALSDLPPREEVAAIRMPTLILAMDDDPGHPLSTAESLHALIPGSQLHVAHSVADVLGWTKLVLEFLDSPG